MTLNIFGKYLWKKESGNKTIDLNKGVIVAAVFSVLSLSWCQQGWEENTSSNEEITIWTPEEGETVTLPYLDGWNSNNEEGNSGTVVWGWEVTEEEIIDIIDNWEEVPEEVPEEISEEVEEVIDQELILTNVDPYFEIRNKQEWSEYYKTKDQLESEWYKSIATNWTTWASGELYFLEWVLSNWEIYRYENYDFEGWILKEVKLYEEWLDNSWNIDYVNKKLIVFYSNSLIKSVDEYNTWKAYRDYDYYETWKLKKYKRFNDKEEELVIIDYDSNWEEYERNSYEYHENWEEKKRIRSYNWEISLIYWYRENWDREYIESYEAWVIEWEKFYDYDERLFLKKEYYNNWKLEIQYYYGIEDHNMDLLLTRENTFRNNDRNTRNYQRDLYYKTLQYGPHEWMVVFDYDEETYYEDDWYTNSSDAITWEPVFTVLINTSTWLIEYFNEFWELVHRAIDKSIIREDSAPEEVINNIWEEELSQGYNWSNNIEDYAYSIINNPTWTKLEWRTDWLTHAFKHRVENIGDTVALVCNSTWDLIQWSWEWLWQKLSILVLDTKWLTPEQIWSDPRYLSDVPEAVRLKYEQAKEIIAYIKDFIKEDLEFYAEHKDEIINRLILNSWKTHEYREWYIDWYISELIAWELLMTIVAWYTRNSSVLKTSIQAPVWDLRLMFRTWVTDVNKLKQKILDNDSRFWDILDIVDNLDWSLDKKYRFYYRLSRIWWPDLKNKLLLDLNFRNNYISWFEVSGKYNPLCLDAWFEEWWKMNLSILPDGNSWKFRIIRSEIELEKNYIPNNPQFSTHIDYVYQNWEVKFWYSHMFLADWKDIDYGWQIFFERDVDWNWIDVEKWDNWTWHFETDWLDFEWRKKVIESFKEKFWIDLSNYEFDNLSFKEGSYEFTLN